MAFQPVPNTAQFTVRYVGAGGSEFWGVNTYNFRYTVGPITSEALEAACTEMATVLISDFAPLISNNLAIEQVSARDLSVQQAVTGFSPVAEVGGVNSPVEPANVTIAVKFLTGAASRSRRGRAFWVGLAESQVVANSVSSGTLNDIASAYGTLQDIMLAIGWQFVVVSRTQNKVKLAEGIPYPVTQVTFTDARVDTKKDRLR